MFFTGLSWLSIIIATIVAFLAGWLYYSPFLFGKIFMKEIGKTPETITEDDKKGMFKGFTMVIVGEFIMSIVAASLVHSLFITSFSQVFVLALSVWLAFILFTKLNDVLFGDKSWKLFFITVGQDLLAILLIFIIVSISNK
jgi:hypothetical protein